MMMKRVMVMTAGVVLMAAAGMSYSWMGEVNGVDGLNAGAVRAVEAESFQVDPVHSNAMFSVMHLGVSRFYGRFTKMSGDFVIDREELENSSIRVVIPAASIDTNAAGRDRDVKGPDLLDAKQFANLSFTSTKVVAAGDDVWKVTGDYTMHGVTKSITVELHVTSYGKRTPMGYRAGLETTFTIKRSEFGMMKYVKEGMLGDEVTIMIGIEGIKK